MDSKNILIVGVNGFIGSHAVDYFLEKGYRIFGCDISDLPFNSNIDYVKVSELNPDFSILFKKQNYEACINASGYANVGFSFQHPDQDYELNVKNVFYLLENIRKFSPECKFINFSSAAVYGNPKSLPISENHKLNPISPYGFHKMAAEVICREYASLYSIPTCSLRVFSAYGERLKKQLFWDIFQKTLNTNHIGLFGTGEESRDFIYILDLIIAVDVIISNGSFNGEAINVSTGEETKISEAVEIFMNALNPEIGYGFTGQAKKGDPNNWKADVSLLNSYGFKPQFSMQEGLTNYCNWIKHEYKND